MKSSLFTKGLIGTFIAAVCCFTPALSILLGAVGLSAITGCLDYILLPALGVSIGVTIYALVTKSEEKDGN